LTQFPIPEALEQVPGPDSRGHFPDEPTLRYVPTFESIGIYWKPADGGAEIEVAVRYRETGRELWHDAMPLWYDPRSDEETDGHGKQYRGSIVHLHPGTTYEIELTMGNGRRVAFTATTWSDRFPIAETVELPQYSTETLVINRSGSPDGYILYTPAPDKEAVIDGKGTLYANVEVHGSYVIIRGLTLKDPQAQGIVLGSDVHHVIIEENDISGWGRHKETGWGVNLDAAIRSESTYGDTTNSHIIIQRNRMHHPRTDSNSWMEDNTKPHKDPVIHYRHHPQGPQGIWMSKPAGGLVIRYNEIFSDDEHKYNDPLGGCSNFSFGGFPNRDSDIYGNIFSHAWDDGIEAEGANMNVRIWGNYIDSTYTGLGIATTSLGPLYIWRNIMDRSAWEPGPNPKTGPFIKAGSDREPAAKGRTYVFHNTTLQRSDAEGNYLGARTAVNNSGGPYYQLVTRNNLFSLCGKSRFAFSDGTESCTNDWDYDWFNGVVKGDYPDCPQQQHGMQAAQEEIATFVHIDSVHPAGYTLSDDAPVIDAGVRIPNFNDRFRGAAPDLGALEHGDGRLEVGVDAYRDRGRWSPGT